MRKAASFERSFSLAAGLWLASLGCLPEQELSAYSAGPEGAASPAPEPGVEPGPAPGGALTPGPRADEQTEAPAEPSDTPAGTDGPAQPEQLAPTEPAAPDSSAAPPAEGMGSAAEPPPAAAAPPSETPAPTAAPEVEPQSAPEPIPVVPDSDPVPAQFRFVRLVADSEFNGGPLSSAAELDVLGPDGQPLDRTGWVATADSAEPTFFGGAPAALAIDGQPGSVWHTAWFQLATPPPHPHFLQLDLGQPRSVIGFRYVARQDASVGRVADYRFFVSADGVEWGEPILAGRLLDSPQAQDVRLPAP